MLNVLLESKAARAKPMGGTLASVLVHGALIVGAIVLTRGVTAARPVPDRPQETATVFRVDQPPPPPIEPASPRMETPTIAPARRLPTIDHVPDALPPIDVELNVPVATDDEIARGPIAPSNPSVGSSGVGHASEGVLESRYVDRSPRIVGRPIQPDFPTSLRERGVNGSVSVQFVVDTLGRAEMGSFRVVEASDPLFAQSVRAVLGRYHFSPGEVGGQKVRTLVQLPFDFTLVR